MDHILLGLAWYVVFVVSVTFHEAAHGFAGFRFGDMTAKNAGLVTMDPVPHIVRSPFGMVIVPIASFLMAGWSIGWASTPYDPVWAHHNRRKSALVSLAGPAANLILIIAAALVIRAGVSAGVFKMPEALGFSRIAVGTTEGFYNSVTIIISIFFSLNLLLLVFNLIPVPPLDGSNIIMLLLSDKNAERYRVVMSQPGTHIFGLIIAWHLLDSIFGPVLSLAIKLLYPASG